MEALSLEQRWAGSDGGISFQVSSKHRIGLIKTAVQMLQGEKYVCAAEKWLQYNKSMNILSP